MYYLRMVIILITIIIAVPIIKATLSAPFVPTPKKAVKKMLKLAKFKEGETVIDPGCGDGRLVIEAAKNYPIKAIGYELFIIPFILAYIRNALNNFQAKILFRDSTKINLADTDVILCYLIPHTLAKLKIKWKKELKPGSRIVSYAFAIEGWKPVHVEPKIPEQNIARILVYEIGKSNN